MHESGSNNQWGWGCVLAINGSNETKGNVGGSMSIGSVGSRFYCWLMTEQESTGEIPDMLSRLHWFRNLGLKLDCGTPI